MKNIRLAFRSLLYLGIIAAIGLVTGRKGLFAQTNQPPPDSYKVRGKMQERPGGPEKDVEVAVHRVPVDLPTVSAAQANLKDDDLVLGVEIDGKPVAYPVRYIAMYEVLDDHVGSTPIAATW